MNKAEALALVGQPVEAWTAANGCYVGTLEEVLPSRPWRGKVRITSVLSAAVHCERGAVCRRGFRPGELIEVGNSSVKPAQSLEGTDYLSALHRSLVDHQRWLERDPNGQYAWTHDAAIKALHVVIVAEERRVQGEPWTLARTP